MDTKLGSKVIIGSVQFGLNYGISNKNGRVNEAIANEIVNIAEKFGSWRIDTAQAYGDSEEVVGRIVLKHPEFRVISKISSASSNELRSNYHKTTKRIGKKSLHALLLHNTENFDVKKEDWLYLKELKDEGQIHKIGVSLYSPADLEKIFKANAPVDIVQIPFSVVDQRFKKILNECKSRKIEVHARSAFLQGLLLMDSAGIPPKLAGISKTINRIQELAKENTIDVSSLLLRYVCMQPEIDAVVIGITTTQEAERNFQSLCGDLKPITVEELDSLAIDDESIILPKNWK